MIRAVRFIAAILLVTASLYSGQARITGALVNGHELKLEVVTSPEAMRQGLMFREKLDEDAGMLFHYSKPQPLSFWMKNTRIPLSIAFLDAEGKILNIADMEPFDEKTMHRSKGDALYALEVNQGWFTKRNVRPGDKVRFLKVVDAQ